MADSGERSNSPEGKPRQSDAPSAGAVPFPRSDITIVRHLFAILERRGLSVFDIDRELGLPLGTYLPAVLTSDVTPPAILDAMIAYVRANNVVWTSAETGRAAPVNPGDAASLADDPATVDAVLAHNHHGMRISTIARWVGAPYEVVRAIIDRHRER